MEAVEAVGGVSGSGAIGAKMKFSTLFVLASLASCSAFAPQTVFSNKMSTVSQLNMAYELKAEPEGGDEVEAIATMDGSRVKNMGATGDKDSDSGEDVYTFWLKAEADGAMIKGFRVQVEKDASKNANFPGFRKGQIPPYAQPQMTMFALQEGIIKTCEAAVEAYGLKAISGEAGSVEVHEDVKDICKGYKVGENVEFTANFKAIFDPEKKQEEAVDVEAEEVAAEE